MAEININYREWATQKKLSIAYETIEIYHPAIGVLRYVTRQQFSKNFTLGPNEPRDANTEVTFEPFGFIVQRPAQNNDPILRLDVQLGRVGTDLKKSLKLINSASDLMTPAELIFRVFLNDEQVQALPLQIASITIKDRDAVIRAEQENPTFRDISRRYIAADFPGLTEIR